MSSYLFRDKYFGRALDKNDFISALWEFFHDGTDLVVPALEATLFKVSQLAETFRTDPCAMQHRFWSSSLLLIYEGDPSVLSDCAQCGNPAGLDEPEDTAPGTGDSEARESDSDTERERHFRDSISKVTPADSPVISPETQPSASVAGMPPLNLTGSCVCSQSGGPRRVDVRLIDFAHTTKVSEKNSSDEGMLLGFDSLMNHLRTLIDLATKPLAFRESEEVRMAHELDRVAIIGLKKETDSLLKKQQKS